jgi:uroporphyrinogen decarboxylase
MAPMSSRERFLRMFAHKEADRVPILDSPWGSTIDRWRREGMPKDVSWIDYFDLDHVFGIGADNSPRFPVRVVDETDDFVTKTTSWGVTMKNWKTRTSTPEFVDFTIKDPVSWREAKKRMTPTRDRVDWDWLAKQYPMARARGDFIEAGFWFGFDATHSFAVGTERVLMAIVEDPDWLVDMFNTFLDVHIALFDMIWDAGYRFDGMMWYDDMGYKNNQFFSLKTYREILEPAHQRAVDWAHAKGVKARLHSCGDVRPFVPEFIAMGIDGLNPIEVKAGMDPVALKKQYGDKLVLHGGINAVLWDKPDEIKAEIERVVPQMKKNGGYIFSSDHSIPSSVSVEDFRGILKCAQKAGAYR